MTAAMAYEYRLAREGDLEAIAGVFAAAFPTSIDHYFDSPPPPMVVAEPFSLCLASEPDALYVADAGGGKIAGYIFAPAQARRLPWVALRQGFAFRWLWGWLSGRYSLGMAPIRGLVTNKVDYLASDRQRGVEADARILSVAVHPDHQGRGVARMLCTLGLTRLDRLGANPVRLEVRPENGPALKLYTDFGFRVKGRTRDSQGDWLIMLRQAPRTT